ncbi:MAG: TerB family tellurite resistance protein [Candidatus Polarisedimenticolaceae bacterium]|nr:TerB family tellurite resistance protein [Candidatus Polarisedimenticolaceae bacterium]
MLRAIQQFFEQNIATAQSNSDAEREHSLQLATAALLFEMMRMDDEIDENEKQLVRKLISQRFTLTGNETKKLIQLAEQEAEQAIDYHCFTSLINSHFSAEEKIDIVEHLWQVAYADGQINKYEDHLVRKISELIYVPHSAFIAAKHRAAAQWQEDGKNHPVTLEKPLKT